MKKNLNSYLATGILIAVFLIAATTLTFAHGKKINIVTTTPDLADIARNVGGDRVTVTSIGRGNQDPHFVEAKPSHMITLKKADLYLVSGLELEIGWSPVLERGSGNSDVMKSGKNYIDCSVGISPLEIPTTAVNRSMGDVHPLGNPHYLLDPNNGIKAAKVIRDALIRKDPSHSKYYKSRYATYKALLVKKQIEWLKAMMPLKGTKVVTYHKTWTYFARRFGLNVVGNVEPKPGISPSPAHVAKLISRMKAEKVKFVIKPPYFESKIPEMICRNTGAKLLTLPTMPGGAKGADTYVKTFDLIISKFKESAK